jgi:DNA gyrase subunit A
MIVTKGDEILAITSAGVVMRTPIEEVRETSRDTLGVRLVNLDEGGSVVSITQVKDVPDSPESLDSSVAPAAE